MLGGTEKRQKLVALFLIFVIQFTLMMLLLRCERQQQHLTNYVLLEIHSYETVLLPHYEGMSVCDLFLTPQIAKFFHPRGFSQVELTVNSGKGLNLNMLLARTRKSHRCWEMLSDNSTLLDQDHYSLSWQAYENLQFLELSLPQSAPHSLLLTTSFLQLKRK